MLELSHDDRSVYDGLWVALVHDRIVASGATAHETLLNCRAARIKDEPVLRFTPHSIVRESPSEYATHESDDTPANGPA